MPIKSAQSTLRSQLKSALNKGRRAQPDIAAAMICKAIANAAGKGLRPIKSSPYVTPLLPTGVGSATSKMSSSFKSMPYNSDIAAAKMASAIATVAPKCKPSGLSSLESKLKKVFKLTTSNDIEKTANEWSAAIIAYFLAGGIK